MVWELFFAFAKVGLLGYGGGPSSIPLMKAEVVRRGWLTETEFLDALAVAPGAFGAVAVAKVHPAVVIAVGALLGWWLR